MAVASATCSCRVPVAAGAHTPDRGVGVESAHRRTGLPQLELRMGPQTNQQQGLGVGLPVNQHQVGLHVAVAVIGPFTAQRVVAVSGIQRSIVDQGVEDGSQARVQRRCMLALGHTPVVALEPGGELNRPHAARRRAPARWRIEAGPSCGGFPSSPRWWWRWEPARPPRSFPRPDFRAARPR